jgi:hypothetical protein
MNRSATSPKMSFVKRRELSSMLKVKVGGSISIFLIHYPDIFHTFTHPSGLEVYKSKMITYYYNGGKK